MRLAALVLVLVASVAACRFHADHDGGQFSCAGGARCPDGETCVRDRCVPHDADPDAGPADADPIDAAPASCDDQFGDAFEYVLCGESASVCQVSAELGQGTCADFCAAHQSECVATHDSATEAPCTSQGLSSCDMPHGTAICFCSR